MKNLRYSTNFKSKQKNNNKIDYTIDKKSLPEILNTQQKTSKMTEHSKTEKSSVMKIDINKYSDPKFSQTLNELEFPVNDNESVMVDYFPQWRDKININGFQKKNNKQMPADNFQDDKIFNLETQQSYKKNVDSLKQKYKHNEQIVNSNDQDSQVRIKEFKIHKSQKFNQNNMFINDMDKINENQKNTSLNKLNDDFLEFNKNLKLKPIKTNIKSKRYNTEPLKEKKKINLSQNFEKSQNQLEKISNEKETLLLKFLNELNQFEQIKEQILDFETLDGQEFPVQILEVFKIKDIEKTFKKQFMPSYKPLIEISDKKSTNEIQINNYQKQNVLSNRNNIYSKLMSINLSNPLNKEKKIKTKIPNTSLFQANYQSSYFRRDNEDEQFDQKIEIKYYKDEEISLLDDFLDEGQVNYQSKYFTETNQKHTSQFVIKKKIKSLRLVRQSVKQESIRVYKNKIKKCQMLGQGFGNTYHPIKQRANSADAASVIINKYRLNRFHDKMIKFKRIRKYDKSKQQTNNMDELRMNLKKVGKKKLNKKSYQLNKLATKDQFIKKFQKRAEVIIEISYLKSQTDESNLRIIWNNKAPIRRLINDLFYVTNNIKQFPCYIARNKPVPEIDQLHDLITKDILSINLDKYRRFNLMAIKNDKHRDLLQQLLNGTFKPRRDSVAGIGKIKKQKSFDFKEYMRSDDQFLGLPFSFKQIKNKTLRLTDFILWEYDFDTRTIYNIDNMSETNQILEPFPPAITNDNFDEVYESLKPMLSDQNWNQMADPSEEIPNPFRVAEVSNTVNPYLMGHKKEIDRQLMGKLKDLTVMKERIRADNQERDYQQKIYKVKESDQRPGPPSPRDFLHKDEKLSESDSIRSFHSEDSLKNQYDKEMKEKLLREKEEAKYKDIKYETLFKPNNQQQFYNELFVQFSSNKNDYHQMKDKMNKKRRNIDKRNLFINIKKMKSKMPNKIIGYQFTHPDDIIDDKEDDQNNNISDTIQFGPIIMKKIYKIPYQKDKSKKDVINSFQFKSKESVKIANKVICIQNNYEQQVQQDEQKFYDFSKISNLSMNLPNRLVDEKVYDPFVPYQMTQTLHIQFEQNFYRFDFETSEIVDTVEYLEVDNDSESSIIEQDPIQAVQNQRINLETINKIIEDVPDGIENIIDILEGNELAHQSVESIKQMEDEKSKIQKNNRRFQRPFLHGGTNLLRKNLRPTKVRELKDQDYPSVYDGTIYTDYNMEQCKLKKLKFCEVNLKEKQLAINQEDTDQFNQCVSCQNFQPVLYNEVNSGLDAYTFKDIVSSTFDKVSKNFSEAVLEQYQDQVIRNDNPPKVQLNTRSKEYTLLAFLRENFLSGNQMLDNITLTQRDMLKDIIDNNRQIQFKEKLKETLNLENQQHDIIHDFFQKLEEFLKSF